MDQPRERILFISSGFPRTPEDSTARFILDLALSLTERGHKIVILAPLDEGALPEEVWKGLKIYRFPYFYPHQWMRLAYGNGIPENIKKNKFLVFQIPFFILMEFIYGMKIVRKEKISIIHAHWLVPQGLVSIFIKKFFPVKNIITVHGSDLRIPPKWLSKIIIRGVDAIISPHPELTDLLRVMDSSSMYEIPNIIDDAQFNPNINSLEIKEELKIRTTHVITFVARLNEFKDPITFVKSIPLVIPHEPDVTFLIVGDGPLMDEIMILVTDLNIQTYVRVLGNRRDVNRILKISSIFVALSPYENIWSLVIIEAMKMGVPCIITNSGTTEKYLRTNVDAILIQPRDEQTLAREIIHILHNNILKKSLSEGGRTLTESNFSTKSIFNKYNVMISDLVRNKKNL